MLNRNVLSNFLLPADPRQARLRQRLLVIAVTFLAVVFLARRAAQNPYGILDDKLFWLLPAAAGGLLLLRRPVVGLVGLVGSALTVPFELSTGTVTRLNAAVLLLAAMLGLWLFEVLVQRQRLPLIRSRTLLPLLVFLLVACLAFAVGQLPWFVFAEKASLMAQAGGLGLFFLAGGAYLLMGGQLRQARWLEWMTWLYLAIGGVYVVGKLAPGLNGLAERVVNAKVYSHSLFWVWMVALAFSQAVFNTHLKPAVRAGLGLLVAATLSVALGQDSGWTSGWLPALVAIGVTLLVSGSRWVWAAAPVALAGLAIQTGKIRALLFVGDNQYSLFTRLEAWRILADIIRVNPVLGLGPSNYYWYTPLYSILGYAVQFNSHNNYVDLVAQVGFLGLAAFLWFAWEIGRLGWRLRSRAPEGFQRAYVYGALGGLAATLVSGMLGDWFLPFIYNVGFAGFRASILAWLFLGGLLALEQIYLREDGAWQG